MYFSVLSLKYDRCSPLSGPTSLIVRPVAGLGVNTGVVGADEVVPVVAVGVGAPVVPVIVGVGAPVVVVVVEVEVGVSVVPSSAAGPGVVVSGDGKDVGVADSPPGTVEEEVGVVVGSSSSSSSLFSSSSFSSTSFSSSSFSSSSYSSSSFSSTPPSSAYATW